MKILGAFIFLVVLCAGSLARERQDVAAFIRDADQFTSFSIDPTQAYSVDDHMNPTDEEKKTERFHQYRVFGKIVATEPEIREQIRNALLSAIGSVKESATILCFDPRHAVCLRSGDRHVDLLLCFECQKLELRYLPSQHSEQQREVFGIGPGGLETLNRLLDDRHVKRDLPKRRTPNQSPEPTPTAGTSAAEPPRVPAAVVAHL